MNDGYLHDTAHLLITGVTGAKGDYLSEGGNSFGGKTALATWFADNPLREKDLVVFGNFKQDAVGEVLTDYTEVGTVAELAEEMGRERARGETTHRFILTPRSPDWPAVSERLEGFIRELDRSISKAVVLDEAPELSEDAILSFVRVHGNGANCKTIVISQSPTDIDEDSIIKQTMPVWVGPMDPDYSAWFVSHKIKEAFDYISENHAPYHWTVIIGKDEGDWHHYKPVPEEYAV